MTASTNPARSPADPHRTGRRSMYASRESKPLPYLLPSEEKVFEVRRHWAALAQTLGIWALFWIGGLLWLALFREQSFLRNIGLWFLVFSLCWLAWWVAEWNVERFVVTDKRVLLVSGILTKRVAIMPLAKVTDLTYERSVIGRALGYGAFIMESAGQQQALSRIDFMPDPDRLYQQMSALLFGGPSRPDDDDGAGNITDSEPGFHEPQQHQLPTAPLPLL